MKKSEFVRIFGREPNEFEILVNRFDPEINLYLLSQDQVQGYDTFDSAIVCAESEDDARRIHPYGRDDDWASCVWCYGPEHVKVKCIGMAADDIPRGVVCASFNAG